MDRPVKERLVGASILAALLVLIVPELLPGPAPGPGGPRSPVSTPEPVRNVTVDLATSKASAPEDAGASSAGARSGETVSAASALPPPLTPTAPPATAPPATAPPPTALPPSTASAAPASTQSEAPGAPLPAPLETASAPPTVVSGRSPAAGATAAIPGHAWAVQLGSFASHDNAEKLLRQMKAQGFSVYVLSGGRGASLRYRVRIGPMADRGAAAQVVAKLKAAGHIGSLVPPAP